MAKSIEDMQKLLAKKVEKYQEFVKNKDAFISKCAKEKLKARKESLDNGSIIDNLTEEGKAIFKASINIESCTKAAERSFNMALNNKMGSISSTQETLARIMRAQAEKDAKAQKKLEQLNAVLDTNNLSHMVDQFTYWDWEDVKELACTKRISVGEACTKYRKTLCSAIVNTARSGLKRYGRLLDVDAKHCVFIFENKQVSYERIYAGGYNIQCLHKRVLLK